MVSFRYLHLTYCWSVCKLTSCFCWQSLLDQWSEQRRQPRRGNCLFIGRSEQAAGRERECMCVCVCIGEQLRPRQFETEKCLLPHGGNVPDPFVTDPIIDYDTRWHVASVNLP
ncbi:hypothetical protein T06_12744 [Trichinella sp. T6]|nr:hypothetical protein T06_12744 [Trichinella sp. T6]